MAAKKGTRPPNAGIGRKKGVPNKVTQSMREAVEKAFNEVGGAAYLVRMSRGTYQERIAFANLCGKLIPLQMAGELSGALEIIHRSE